MAKLVRMLAFSVALVPAVAPGQRPVRVPVVEPAPSPSKADSAPRSSRPQVDRGTFSGLVTDTSLVPIAEAEVTVLRSPMKGRTDSNGRFQFIRMPAGQYLVIVRRVGYRPTYGIVEVPANDTLRSYFALARALQGLDTVRVVTERRSLRMMEFEDRRKRGEGQFITQEQIDKHNSVFVSDLIRSFFRGVNIEENRGRGGGQSQEYVISNRGFSGVTAVGDPGQPSKQIVLPVGCALQIIVDDVAMPTPFDLMLLPSPRDIAGIELYAGPATLPVRYNSLDAHCGLVLIWTKDGS